jgi:hypothetical protein
MDLRELAAVLDATGPTGPASAQQVRDTLQRVAASLPDSDGISWFTKLYIKVAERVGAALAQGEFEDPAFIEALDSNFVSLYFSALRAYAGNRDATPRAWYPVFAVHDSPDIAPIQFALAGMNAHINRDLMVALVQTWQAREIDPESDSSAAGACKRDYDRVNELLAQVELQVRGWFLQGLAQRLEHLVERIDRTVERFSLVEARQSAWNHARALWALRAAPLLTTSYIDTIDGLVGFAGRGLLLPVV